MAMPDLHGDNILIKTVEDNVVCLSRNVFNLIYSTFFLQSKKCATFQATFEQKPQIKINSFQNQKHGFLINA